MLVSFADMTVTVERPTLIEEWNQTVTDWGNSVSHEIEGCTGNYLDPAETVLGVDVNAATYGLYLPEDADIQQNDRVRHLGKTWEIVGDVRREVSPTGELNHTFVTLKRWDGKK